MTPSALGRLVAVVGIGTALTLTSACGGSTRPIASAKPRASAGSAATATTAAPPSTTATPAPDSGGDAPEVSGRNVNADRSVGAPTAVEIPSIKVRSSLLKLDTAPDGTAEVPADPQLAGWFSGGTRPGDEGPAVILGHIDSKTGPAVFYRLRDLVAGAKATITTASGRRIEFTVDRVVEVAKREFPTSAVYGPAFGRQLRLITCGGTFDRSKGHYTDNVIAYLTASKRAGQP